MSEAGAVERLLRRDRWITLGGLATLCVMAWVYVATGAGLGMSVWEMTSASLFPHLRSLAAPMDMSDMSLPGMAMEPMAQGSWAVSKWALVIAMWWVMMIAMMSPSAAPTILLYARVHRHAVAQNQLGQKVAPTGAFAAGYLLVWFGFSIAAAGLHGLLERTGLLSPMMIGSESRWLSAGVLVAAGLYQLSPIKHLCLAHCRAPSGFLARHWRPGPSGALRLGVLHGAYCVSCCWVLMALLFVGGVMNLIWIAGLAIIVLVEKVAPGGEWAGRALGVALIFWGVATLLV